MIRREIMEFKQQSINRLPLFKGEEVPRCRSYENHKNRYWFFFFFFFDSFGKLTNQES